MTTEYFKYLDAFLEKINQGQMYSITDIGFSIFPDVVKKLMENKKYHIYFTTSSFIDTFEFKDIIIKMPNVYLYFSRGNNESTFLLKIIHTNNTEEIKIFLRGLKQINKI